MLPVCRAGRLPIAWAARRRRCRASDRNGGRDAYRAVHTDAAAKLVEDWSPQQIAASPRSIRAVYS